MTPARTPPPAPTAGHYDALDGLRGFAVLLVYCVHAAGNAAAVTLGIDFAGVRLTTLESYYTRVLFWLHASHHGVFLFFVLSGFLIGRMWWPRAALPYATFAWRRTLRIYPAFLVAFVASLAFAYAGGTWVPPDLPRVLGNALLLNGAPGSSIAPFNIVTWSLFYEMTFYLAFPVFAMAAWRIGAGGGVLLWTSGVLGPLAAIAFGVDTLAVCFSLLFIGVALAVHETPMRAYAARTPTAVVVLAYLTVTSVALFQTVPALVAILAFGAAAMLLLAKSMTPGNAVSWLFTSAPLRALGRISYSFYLVHWMLVVLVARAIEPHVPAWGAFAATIAIFVAGFAVSAAAAAALWWLAERPYFAWTRGRIRAAAR